MLRHYARIGVGVCFVAETPSSERGLLAQAVLLTDFHMKRAKDGSVLVEGRDAALEAERDILTKLEPKSSYLRKRPKKAKRWRQFRLSRIVRGTLHAVPDLRPAGARG